YTAWKNADFNGALALVKRIPNVEGYRAVSTNFRNITERETTVTNTLVTGLSEKFGSHANWFYFQNEFRRIGLVLRDGKWYLAGLGGPKTKVLVTNQPAT